MYVNGVAKTTINNNNKELNESLSDSQSELICLKAEFIAGLLLDHISFKVYLMKCLCSNAHMLVSGNMHKSKSDCWEEHLLLNKGKHLEKQ